METGAQHTRRGERGYNLVEVLIATALVAVVVLSISTLFFLARRNVYSGKQMTQAISIGNQAMEDLSHMTLQGVYDAFNIVDATSPALIDRTIDGVAYDDVLIRSTDPAVVTTPPDDIDEETAPAVPAGAQGLLTQWTTLINGSTKLANGSVTVILSPRQQTAGAILDANERATARILSIRVIVRWREAMRQRSVVFDTVKTRRG